MARQIRLEFPGACYHVINRGNYRRDLFAMKGAAEAFESVLFEAAARCGWRVHAYVIMRNHFHLAVETPGPNLSLGMKFLQGTWANRFNRFHGLQGRPFPSPFASPSGIGQSSPVVNFLWGFLNLLAGILLFARQPLTANFYPNLTALFMGILLLGLFNATHFGKVQRGELKK